MVTKDRLAELFKNVKNQNIKIIIAEVVGLEKTYRVGDRDNFPKQKIRDIIDSEARLIERGKSQ